MLILPYKGTSQHKKLGCLSGTLGTIKFVPEELSLHTKVRQSNVCKSLHRSIYVEGRNGYCTVRCKENKLLLLFKELPISIATTIF